MASIDNAALLDRRASRWPELAELAAVIALTAGHDRVPLTATPFFLALGWISLRRGGLRWRDVGLSRPRSWPAAFALGTLAGIAMELLSTYVTVPALSRLLGSPPDLSDFRPMVGNLKLLAVALAASWILAAFGEELAFRGYLLNRLAGLGRDTRGNWLLSLIVVSAIFGWCHEAQALTGILQEGWAGLLLGLLYLGCGRNLAVPIIAHGMSNSLAFVLIYLGRYPGV